MRISWFLALPFAALGVATSLTTACDSGGITCQNPTTQDQTCLTCINSSCSNDVSAVESECGSSISCGEACNCGDQSCSSKCKSGDDAGSACLGAGLGLAACISSMCKPQCSGTMFQ